MDIPLEVKWPLRKQEAQNDPLFPLSYHTGHAKSSAG
jgi:hypothetical protein